MNFRDFIVPPFQAERVGGKKEREVDFEAVYTAFSPPPLNPTTRGKIEWEERGEGGGVLLFQPHFENRNEKLCQMRGEGRRKFLLLRPPYLIAAGKRRTGKGGRFLCVQNFARFSPFPSSSTFHNSFQSHFDREEKERARAGETQGWGRERELILLFKTFSPLPLLPPLSLIFSLSLNYVFWPRLSFLISLPISFSHRAEKREQEKLRSRQRKLCKTKVVKSHVSFVKKSILVPWSS